VAAGARNKTGAAKGRAAQRAFRGVSRAEEDGSYIGDVKQNIGDVKQIGLNELPRQEMYLPYWQSNGN
jgi:hypothetical protein